MSGAAGKVDPTNLLDFNLNGSMTLTSGQVCMLLGMSEPTFRRQLRLGKLTNFPPRLPGMGKWSKPAVVAWISSNGQLSSPAPRSIAFPDAEIEAHVHELESRYVGRPVAA